MPITPEKLAEIKAKVAARRAEREADPNGRVAALAERAKARRAVLQPPNAPEKPKTKAQALERFLEWKAKRTT